MKKIIKFILITLLVLVLLSSVFGFIDYQLVKHHKSPIFCFHRAVIQDGGSRVYVGLGYNITDYYNQNTGERKPSIGILLYSPADPFPAGSRDLILFNSPPPTGNFENLT